MNPNIRTSSTSSTSSASSSASSSIASASTSALRPTAVPGESANQQTLPSPDPQSDDGSNAGAIAGGVVGGAAVLAILAAAIWFFRRRARKNRQREQLPPSPGQGYQPPPMAPATIPQPGISVGGLHEAFAPTNEKDATLLDSRERYEIGYQDKEKNNRQELPG
ncbi:MAG: hypothetical protein Q9216_003819 [Gyalolechia sp. 2 TL-2023]